MDDLEHLHQLLVLIIEPVPGEHEPEGVQNSDVEGCVHRYRTFRTCTVQVIDETLRLDDQLLLHARLAQSEGPKVTHGKTTTLGPRWPIREQDAWQNSKNN